LPAKRDVCSKFSNGLFSLKSVCALLGKLVAYGNQDHAGKQANKQTARMVTGQFTNTSPSSTLITEIVAGVYFVSSAPVLCCNLTTLIKGPPNSGITEQW